MTEPPCTCPAGLDWRAHGIACPVHGCAAAMADLFRQIETLTAERDAAEEVLRAVAESASRIMRDEAEVLARFQKWAATPSADEDAAYRASTTSWRLWTEQDWAAFKEMTGGPCE